MEKTPNLKKDFPLHDYSQWKDAALKLLKGASFEKLRTKLDEGFTLEPIYRAEDINELAHLHSLPGMPPFIRGYHATGYRNQSWKISQHLSATSSTDLHRLAQEVLNKGQDELNLQIGDVIHSASDLRAVIDKIDLNQCAVYLRNANLAVAEVFISIAKESGFKSDALKGCIALDPLTSLAKEGSMPMNSETMHQQMAQLVCYLDRHAPMMQSIAVDSSFYREAGAGAISELAYAMATTVEYFRAMHDQGLNINQIANKMRFSMGLGGNFFIEIAKLRAARYLYSKVVKAFNGDPNQAKAHFHSTTILWNQSIFDPHVNLLRDTSEAFAAVVGGTDSLNISTFDERLNGGDDFSKRVARNTQLVLAHECELRHVADPAGGSYYIEWLTDKLARMAWDQFVEIEKAGGMAKALQSGLIKEQLDQAVQEKRKALATRKTLMVGTTIYPIAGEKVSVDHVTDSTKRSATTPKAKALIDALSKNDHEEIIKEVEKLNRENVAFLAIGDVSALPKIEAIKRQGLADDFESLRFSAQAYQEKKRKAPLIFQANIGPSRNYRARADWTSGLFEVGGFSVLNKDDFEDGKSAADALKKSGAQIAVITSSDAIYAERLKEVVNALKGVLPQTGKLLLAGHPGEHEENYRNLGIDDFVHVRINVYQMLSDLLGGLS